MAPPKFSPGDKVIFDRNTPSHKQQIWGEVIKPKHHLLGAQEYEVRVLKRNVFSIEYDIRVQSGTYVEKSTWVEMKPGDVVKANEEEIKICDSDPSKTEEL